MDNQNMPRVTEQAGERALFLAHQRRKDNIPDYIGDDTIMKGEITQHEWEGWQARAALASPSVSQQAAPEAPAGYKLVPIEPTPEMQQAGHDTPGAHMYNASYRAMVAAAPAQAAQQEEAAVDLDPNQVQTIADRIRNTPGLPAATTASASTLQEQFDRRADEQYGNAPAPSRDAREEVARAICIACEEMPDHIGDARGNAFRWQDYLDVADAAIAAMSASQDQTREAK